MEASWIPWSSTFTVIMTLLQIQGLMGVTTRTVTGVYGETLSFKCCYPQDLTDNVKYFYKVVNNVDQPHIQTNGHDQRNGRFSLSNATNACIIIEVDKLTQEDGGTYWCGVDVSSQPDIITIIQLEVQAKHSSNVKTSWPVPTTEPPFITEVNKPLFLTAVMCVAAMLFVCLFTLCLLLTMKYKRSAPRHSRQTSADYETMMPGVRKDEPSCSCPECIELSAFSSPPPDLCSNFKPKQRESTVSFSICEYVDVDAPEHMCQYQSLNVSQIEDRVYHDLHRNRLPKDERLTGVKQQMNC